MPTLDAANAAFNLVKVLAEGLPVGPLLLGISRPAHIVTPSVTARGLINVTALAVVDAQPPSPNIADPCGANGAELLSSEPQTAAEPPTAASG